MMSPIKKEAQAIIRRIIEKEVVRQRDCYRLIALTNRIMKMVPFTMIDIKKEKGGK